MKELTNQIAIISKLKDDKLDEYTTEPVDFEDAIKETSFGKFNIFIMIFMWMVSLAFIFDTTVMSYVIPSAECDLNISLLNKGLMNSIVHLGMICSAFFTGYLADTLGRKKILFGGLLCDVIFNIITTFSHSLSLTLTCRFFSGFFMAGVSTVQVTMMAEFHSAKYRSSLTMYIGVTFSIGMLTAPFLAWLILTNSYNISFGSYAFHSWQVYLTTCSLPSIFTLLCVYIVPESPKFLVSRNQMDEALAILRRIYAINTGKSPQSYPVKSIKPLGKENVEQTQVTNEVINRNPVNAENKNKLVDFMKSGLNQMKPLILSEHRMKLLLFFAIQFVAVLAQNSVRLWLPQLFKMMSEHSADETFCNMISLGHTSVVEAPRSSQEACEPIIVAPETYVNSMIVAGSQVICGGITSLTVNYLGLKRVLIGSLLVSGTSTLLLYWSTSTVQVTILASLSVALSSTSVSCLVSANVDVFPTSLRAMALSLTLMVGRIGSIIGNLIFPSLLSLGCLPPFLTVACGLFGGTILSFFIQKPIKETL